MKVHTGFAEMDNLDWNDLRYVLAVARGRSVAAAARALGVSHATVLRRIHTLEEGVGTPLFYRLATGYEINEAGRRLTEVGDSIEAAVAKARQVIEGQSIEVAGNVRFTTTDSLACTLMPAILHGLHERYPGIKVEMIATNARLDLDRREADVALRPARGKPPESWVGRCLGGVTLGLFAATAYLSACEGSPDDWSSLDWVVPGGVLLPPTASHWMDAIPASRRVMSANSFTVLRDLAVQCVGATILPLFVGRDSGLRLLHAFPPDSSASLWLLTHANLRRAKRIQLFMSHVAESVQTALRNPSSRS